MSTVLMLHLIGGAMALYVIVRILVRKHYNRRTRRIIEDINRELHALSGGRCNKCGEQYVGLALDCRCTNYGLPCAQNRTHREAH